MVHCRVDQSYLVDMVCGLFVELGNPVAVGPVGCTVGNFVGTDDQSEWKGIDYVVLVFLELWRSASSIVRLKDLLNLGTLAGCMDC